MERLACFVCVVDDVVNGFAQHIVAVQVDIQIGWQIQFPCQILNYRNKKRVDGFYVETAIIMREEVESYSAPSPYFLVRDV